MNSLEVIIELIINYWCDFYYLNTPLTLEQTGVCTTGVWTSSSCKGCTKPCDFYNIKFTLKVEPQVGLKKTCLD